MKTKKKWYNGETPMSRERKAKKIIFELLPEDGSEMSWSILEERAKEEGISSTTLSKHLKEFVRLGRASRRVDGSTYPPRTYYSIRNDSVKGRPPFKLIYEDVLRKIEELPEGEGRTKRLVSWLTFSTNLIGWLLTLTWLDGIDCGSEEEALKHFDLDTMLDIEHIINTTGLFCRAVGGDAEKALLKLYTIHGKKCAQVLDLINHTFSSM